MFSWAYYSGALTFCAAMIAGAQGPIRSIDPVFARAQELVSDGNGTAGRALVDSVIRATSPTSPLYPQALFWRATLATNAADAESDYRHIVVDYPLAPQAEDALLRLAQLELARGDRDDALTHLQRIPRDYPRSKSLARASYWMARVLFEKNDIANACAANASALSQTTAGEVELRNQIQYQGQRCAAYTASRTVATATQSASSTPTSVTVSASSTPTSVIASASSTPTSVIATTALTPGTPGNVDAKTVAPEPLTEGRDTKPSVIEPREPAKTAPANPVSATTASSSGGSGYSVQVAAYNRKPQADKLASTLSTRGYEARVDGSVAPFRVRIGRYPTAREAEAALKQIRAKGMAGFVVRAPER